MTIRWRVSVVFVGLLLVAQLSLAHHNGQAVSNYNYLVAVTGVVTGYEFVNPHALLHVTAMDESGNSEEWVASGGNPGMTSRLGYSAHMFKIGEERITVYGFSQKNGEKRMVNVKLVRANGEDIPVYQTERDWLEEFMTQHNVHAFKDLPSTLVHYIGGPPYQANDDK